MNDMARMLPATFSFPTAPAAPIAAVEARQPRDPVGMWYAARKRHGIDDRMWFGLYETGSAAPQWHTRSHRFSDGIGGLSLLLQECGHDGGALAKSARMQRPDWRALWRTRKAVLAPAVKTKWKKLDPALQACASHIPVSLLLDIGQSLAIEEAAHAAGVSSTVWLLWTADRALREILADHDSVSSWVYPVSLRGAVPCTDPFVNQCSGFGVHISAATSPLQLKQQIAARFARFEHWRQWWALTLGRWIGQAGINVLYRLLRAAPGRHTGSYSNLGEWNASGLDGISCSAPGSPAYPVAVSTVLCNGRRTLACRLHPVIGGSSERAIEFLTLWRELSATTDSLSGW